MRKTHYFIYILLLLYSPCAYSTISNKVQAKNDDASKLFVSPDTIRTALYQDFAINISVAAIENLFAVAFDVLYDTGMMTFQGITESNFLNENGEVQTFFLTNHQPGKLIVAVSRADNSIPGASTETDIALVNISFKTKTIGQASLQLENTGLLDTALTPLPFLQLDGVVQIFGQPVLAEIPDQEMNTGDTLVIALNDYVHDPDTPTNLLTWEVMEAPFLYYNVDNTNNTLTFWPAQIFEETSLTIKVSDPDGFSDEKTIAVIMPLSINDLSSKSYTIRAYPNPFRDRLVVKIDSKQLMSDPLSISMWNMAGLMVGKLSHLYADHRGQYVIYLNEDEFGNKKIADGLYIIKTELDGAKQIIKVIKSSKNN